LGANSSWTWTSSPWSTTAETTATTAATIGELAAQGGLVLHELTTIRASLEEAYMTLTSDSVEYRTDPASQAQMQQAQVRQAVPQGSARG